MSPQILYETTLSRTAQKRLFIKLLGNVSLVAFTFYSDGFGLVWLQWVGLAIVLPFAVLQLMILVYGRRPLVLEESTVVLRTALSARIDRDKILGLAPDLKTGQPGLVVASWKDPQNTTIIRLPWGFISESREAVLDAFHLHYGLDFNGANT